MSESFKSSVELPVSVEEAYAWHLRRGALERLTPPWEPARVLSQEGVHDGARTVLEMSIGPVKQRWVAEHSDVRTNEQFVDTQVDGPFSAWRHTHRFESLGEQRSVLHDEIEYKLPLGGLGKLFGGGYAARRLEKMFAYRHAIVADDLRRHAELRGKKRIAVTGATGLIGTQLCAFLSTGGHEVVRVLRRDAGPDDIAWNPDEGTIDRDRLVGVDAVVHLAGDNIGDGRWSDEKKRTIRESRVRGTRLIADTLASMHDGPRTLVCASAIGYYGDRKEPVDETSAPGQGFLPEVCEEWERAADPAREAGLRVAHTRFGVVLSLAGGALAKLAPAFSAGVGGRVGRGEQGMSWVALDDVVYALHATTLRDDLDGALNVTAPNPVDNDTFVHVLGRVMHRPSVLPLPGAAVKLALGEMGEALLLEGAFVHPARLVAAQHRFSYPELEPALRHLLGH